MIDFTPIFALLSKCTKIDYFLFLYPSTVVASFDVLSPLRLSAAKESGFKKNGFREARSHNARKADIPESQVCQR
jgi:hypothetical protein